MIPINDQKLALTNRKPTKRLRYKTVSVAGWWLVRTDRVEREVTYTPRELGIIKDFVSALWKRGYRKTMEQMVRATRNKALIDCFYKSTSLKEWEETEIGGEKTTTLPQALYQKRAYSVYRLCHDLVGKEVCLEEDLIGKYKKITDWVSIDKENKREWHKVTGLLYNQRRANVSLVLEGGTWSRCVIKDGTLNMPCIGVRGLSQKLPRGVKTMNLVMEDEQLLDLTKLPISSRADFPRRLPSRLLARVVAELEYAKMAKKQFIDHPSTNSTKKRGFTETKATYKAACLEIGAYYRPCKLISDQGVDWNKEYERLRKEKSKLVFEIFAKKLWAWQEPKAECVVGCRRKVRVGPEKILIEVKINNILNRDIKI